jgi:hypothetical protein
MIFKWIEKLNLDSSFEDDLAFSFLLIFAGSLFGVMISIMMSTETFNPWGMVIGYSLFCIAGFLFSDSKVISFICFSILWTIVVLIVTKVHLTWILIPIILVLNEIFFLLDTEKFQDEETFCLRFTLYKKFEAFIETILFLIYSIGIITIIKKIVPWIVKNKDTIINWIGYIGIGIIALVGLTIILFLWIKLNSLKYKEKIEDEKNKKKKIKQRGKNVKM